MKIKNNNNYYVFSDNISKNNIISQIKVIKKTCGADKFKLKLISEMLKLETNTLNKNEFAVVKAENYDLSFNIVQADLFNHLIWEHRVEYIDQMFVTELNLQEVEKLFIDYLNNQKLNEQDFNVVMNSQKVRLNLLKNDYTKYASRISLDAVYQADEQYLTLTEQEQLIENLTLADLEQYLKTIEIESSYIFHKTNSENTLEIARDVNSLTIKRYEYSNEYSEEEYDLEIDQAKVNVIYEFTKNYTRIEQTIFNLVFGGDSFSKLFVNVREAHSLCYYVNSKVINRDLIKVQTGVNRENIEKVIGLIDDQLTAIKLGNVEELVNAKDKLISLYSSIENDYYSRKALIERNIINQENDTIESLIAEINAIKPELIVEMANNTKKIKRVVVK